MPTPPKKDPKKKDERWERWKKREEVVTCPTCRGSGRYGNHTCGLCHGTGKIKALKNLCT